MIKATAYEDLNINVNVQTMDQRLEFCERVTELMRQDRAKCNKIIRWAWDAEWMEIYDLLTDQAAFAKEDCLTRNFKANPDGSKPPWWPIHPSTHIIDGIVEYSDGLELTNKGDKYFFLLAMNGIVNDEGGNANEDLIAKLAEARQECKECSYWGTDFKVMLGVQNVTT